MAAADEDDDDEDDDRDDVEKTQFGRCPLAADLRLVLVFCCSCHHGKQQLTAGTNKGHMLSNSTVHVIRTLLTSLRPRPQQLAAV